MDELPGVTAASTTTWAGLNLLDHLGGANNDAARAFSFQIGARANAGVDDISASINGISSTRLSVQSSSAVYDVTESNDWAAVAGSNEDLQIDTTSGLAFARTFNTTAGEVDFSGDVTITFADTNTGTALDSKTIVISVATTDTAAVLARKAAEAFNKRVDSTSTGTNAYDADFVGFTATVSGATMSIKKGISVTDAYASRGAITAIDNALSTVNTQRASLGAISNRLDSTVSNLTNIATNLEAGLGRIQDADFAAETTNLAKSQILQQAAMAMLAQANASKQGVLSLLQR